MPGRNVRYETPKGESRIGVPSDISRSTRPGRAEFWRSIPTSSASFFYAGVFCLFSAVGFMFLMMTTAQVSRAQIFLQTLVSGGFAVLYAAAGVRRKFLYMPLIALPQMAAFTCLGWIYRNHPILADARSGLPPQLHVLGFAGITALLRGTCSSSFSSPEKEPVISASTRKLYWPSKSIALSYRRFTRRLAFLKSTEPQCRAVR